MKIITQWLRVGLLATALTLPTLAAQAQFWPKTVTGGAVRGDFDSNGSVDYVLSQQTTRQTAIWYLQNTNRIQSAFGPSLPAGWVLVTAALVNADGQSDYILFNPSSRQTACWFLDVNGTHILSSTFGPTLPSGWTLADAADLNQDGAVDLVLTHQGPATTAVAFWYLNNSFAFAGGANGPGFPSAYSFVAAADFNADTNPDYLLFNSSTRQTAVYYLEGTALLNSGAGPTLPAGYILNGTADFNHDSHIDYVLFNPSTRQTAVWFLNGINGTNLVTGVFGPTLVANYTLAFP